MNLIRGIEIWVSLNGSIGNDLFKYLERAVLEEKIKWCALQEGKRTVLDFMCSDDVAPKSYTISQMVKNDIEHILTSTSYAVAVTLKIMCKSFSQKLFSLVTTAPKVLYRRF